MLIVEEQSRDAGTGLCALCRHAQIIASAKGSRFLLCRLAATDFRFVKYPWLPVLHCDGFMKEEPKA